MVISSLIPMAPGTSLEPAPIIHTLAPGALDHPVWEIIYPDAHSIPWLA